MINGLLAQNVSPTSLLMYALIAGPTGGCLHYGARRLLGRISRTIARLAVITLAIGAITLAWKTGLLHHAIATGPVTVDPNTYSAR